MTDSAKRRHAHRYHAAMDRIELIDPDAADDIHDYMLWLQAQITYKRKQNAALRVEIDELGGGYNPHQFRNQGAA